MLNTQRWRENFKKLSVRPHNLSSDLRGPASHHWYRYIILYIEYIGHLRVRILILRVSSSMSPKKTEIQIVPEFSLYGFSVYIFCCEAAEQKPPMCLYLQCKGGS